MASDSLADTIIPKSDQLNSDELAALGPQTYTVERVGRGASEQPIDVHLTGLPGKPYRPCKTMRRVLISLWGDKGADWIGKSLTLYCDPDVSFGGVKVGGIRISHMSHIDSDQTLRLTATRGQKRETRIKKLVMADDAWIVAMENDIANAATMADLQTAFGVAQLEAKARKDKSALDRFIAIKDIRKGELAGAPDTGDAA